MATPTKNGFVKPTHAQLLTSVLAPVYRGLPLMALMNAVVAALVVGFLYTEIVPATLATWLGGILLVSAARLMLWQRQRRTPMTPSNARLWANLLVLSAGASGIVWGAAGVVFFLPDSPFLQVFIILVLGGMAAGALATSSQYAPAFYVFVLTAALPLEFRVAMVGDPLYLTMGVLIGLYLAVMLVLSHRIGKSFAGVIALELERDTAAIQFQDFAEVSSDWFWEMDVELRLSYISRQMTKTGGLNPAVLLGKQPNEILQYRSDPKDWKQLQDDLAHRRPFRNFVCHYPTPTGGNHYFQMSGKPLFEDGDRFIGYRGVAMDITAERLAEGAVREEQERLQKTIDNVFDGIVTIDEDGRIQSVNPAVTQMFGYTEEECIGLPFFEAFVPMSYETSGPSGGGLTASLQNLNAASSIRENVALRKDGSIFYVDLVMSRMMYSGEEVRIAVVRDITQQKELHAQLLQASKLGILGEMAAGVTHELSQPLNVIRMAAENVLLRLEVGNVDPEFAYGKFRVIAEQSERMGETINHLRVFSREDSDRAERFYVSWIVEQAVQLIENPFALENIRIATEIPNEPVSVKGSVSRLERMLLSLLYNARDSILERWREEQGVPQKGAITIRVRTSQYEQTVRIVIQDDGLGILPENLDRVFDPSFATKEGGKVSGLGLFIVHGIVTAMSGEITVANGPIGTRFEITLPRAIGADAQPMGARLLGG